MFETLDEGDRLIAVTITDDSANNLVVFDACKPGCPPQSFIDELLGVCRRTIVRKDNFLYKVKFVQAVLPLVIHNENYPNSAIIESVLMVSRQYGGSGIAKFFIFSDLLENSRIGKFSNWIDRGAAVEVEYLRRRGLVANLEGVEVVVFGFGRGHGKLRKGLPVRQRQRVEEFWRA